VRNRTGQYWSYVIVSWCLYLHTWLTVGNRIHLNNVTVAQLFIKLPTPYCSNTSTPLVSIRSQINPLHYSHPISLRSYKYYFLINFQISQVFSSGRFFPSNPILHSSSPQYVLHARPILPGLISLIECSSDILHPNRSISYRMNSLDCAATEYIERFVGLNVTWWTERIITIVNVQICRCACHFVPFMLLSTVFSNTLSLSSSHLTRYQVSHPCKPGIKTAALYILIFKPMFCTHDDVIQKIAYIAQRCGKTALKRGKGKGSLDIVRWRPSNFSLLKRDECSLHSKTFPLSPYFSFWHVNNTSWIICGSAYYLLTYEISYLPHRFTCC